MAHGLNRHFVIGADLPATPAGWRRAAFGGWEALAGADVRRHRLTAGGEDVGLMLGWVVGEAGVLDDGTVVEVPAGAADIGAWAADLCGRFVLVFHADAAGAPVLRVALDAGGLLGAVYDPKRRRIASTPALLSDGAPPEADVDLVAAFGMPARHGWYPFGLTPARGVQRLMPNFELSLDDFTPHRAWPGPGDIVERRPEEAAPLIYDRVSRNACAIAAWRPAAAFLTAGYDSRMMLAALKPAAHEIPFVTIDVPGTGAALDVRVAARLSARFGLRHEARPFIDPTPADAAEWFERAGGCIADVVAGMGPTVAAWDPAELQLTGACGEVGRAFYWTEGDIGAPRPDAAALLRRFGLPATPTTIAAGERWLETTPAVSTTRLWDLAYIEQRLGCWAGASVYGATQPLPSLSPYNARDIFALMLGLPEGYRAGDAPARDFIAVGWPELNETPFNRPEGFDRLRFLKSEAKAMLPKPLKQRLARLLRSLR